MIKYVLIAIALYMAFGSLINAVAQVDSTFEKKVRDSLLQIKLDEIVITASKYEQNTFSAARVMTVVSMKELNEKRTFSVLDVLDDKIGVWIEKRTTSTSDPVIRGLSGANILALVDGNNFSTLWGEGGFGGDDLYGKVDGESIERIEVIRGPASVVYGSNALGGVINFITKKSPFGFTDKGWMIGGKIRAASGSASEYFMGRVETWGASPHIRYFIGASAHQSENMRAGGDAGYINPSGGKDHAVDMNMDFKIGNNNFMVIGGQLIDRPEIFRSYRPAQSNTNERVGWNIGYCSTDTTLLFDVFKMNAYHQYKKDTRTWYTDNSRTGIDYTGYAWWKNYSGNIHAVKKTGLKNRLLYGAVYYLDIAESPDDEQFSIRTITGVQKAAPGTHWHNAGAYVQNEWDANRHLSLSAGLRYDYFYFSADDELFYSKPGDSDTTVNKAIRDQGRFTEKAFTGSAALILHLRNNINLVGSWAHGFRMNPPSFGFRQTGQGVLIPNGLLDPVTADMFEISPRLRTKVMDINLTGYYTMFTNFQQPIYGLYRGSSYLDFNNNGSFEPDERVFVNTPDGTAYVAGLEAEFNINLNPIWSLLNGFHLSGGMMFNYGEMKFPGEREVPFRYTHPFRSILKIRFDDPSPKDRGWIELTADMVAKYTKIEEERLKSDVGYLQNPQDPLSGLYRDYGLPSYRVFDIRGGMIFNKYISVSIAVENLLDIRYRSAHSRMDASGRNVLVGVEMKVPEWNKIKHPDPRLSE